ncbi:hypothetical protein RFI_03851 [Reticulomyxa filosa]|uniref:Uncharacterized protein n=1 Tax=Reticulomyxa filosa TaxID=46433 RepID=X6P6L3_RETFI|nr:hypothetical protein RFI_03851 [Reticulomyxa filosa]|eukprot:ETO33257.1 hypothetical protein RFI_03851 [Reticulomyxa filosa]
MNKKIRELQNTVKDLQSQIEKMQENDNEQNKQIDNLKRGLLEKDQTMIALADNIQQFKKETGQYNVGLKKQMEQYQVKFEEFKSMQSKYNIQQLKSQTDAQTEEEEEEEEEGQKNEQKEKEITTFDCGNMLSFIESSDLKNGVDFLLVNEYRKLVKLTNNEWNDYKFGIFLFGEKITLTVDCNKDNQELGYLKIKTSHLWIKDPSSKIDCSELGYAHDQGPGRGGSGKWGSGGGYGTKGSEGEDLLDSSIGRETYGEETLLKEIHFGSGGGSGRKSSSHPGSGGGIIKLLIEQQLINHGSIRSNGGNGWRSGGGGSGGSILIELQCQSQSHPNTLKHTFGTITCTGGNSSGGGSSGGEGRIAIYGSTKFNRISLFLIFQLRKYNALYWNAFECTVETIQHKKKNDDRLLFVCVVFIS